MDAAIAAVALQGVIEPQMTGIGGDCFVIYSPKAGAPVALNGSGRTPAKTDLAATMAKGAAAGHRLVRTAMLSSLGLGSLAGFCVTVAVLIPDGIGRAVLKDNWEGADQLMLPAGLLLVVVALVLGASNGIVALSRTDLLLRVTVTQAPLMLILGVFGAWTSGVVAATYGMVAAQAVGLVLCWIMFIRADAEAQRRGPVIN
jgi:O-antigen/teichoic acid export membrane protein